MKSVTLKIAILLFSFSAFAYQPFEHMKQGTLDLFKKENAQVFIYGTTATVFSLLVLDRSVDHYFSNHNRLGGLEAIGNQFLGTGIIGVSIGLSALAHAYFQDNDHSLQAGEAQLEALLANLGYTTALKLAIPHERPDGGDHYSFPSGHTSTLFTTASVVDQFYGLGVASPLYFLAGFTALSRMAASRHHLSDALFGGMLGYLIGRSYSKHHLVSQSDTPVSVLPFLDDQGSMGLTTTLLF